MRCRCMMLVAIFITAAQGVAFGFETGSMRCEKGIISIGDTAGKVLDTCGQPSYAAQRERREVDHSPKGKRTAIREITIDDWIYNFGPNQFQYQVSLENGRITHLESLEYGY